MIAKEATEWLVKSRVAFRDTSDSPQGGKEKSLQVFVINE
jgi:hypothetical protein